MGVFVLTFHHFARGLYHKLALRGSCELHHSGINAFVKCELSQSIAVAQIDEGHASKVASALDPAA